VPEPPLKFLHSAHLLNPAKLALIERLTTDQILTTLRPDNKSSLKVRTDGTVLDGHHRLDVLQKRGVDIDSLPREVVTKLDFDEPD